MVVDPGPGGVVAGVGDQDLPGVQQRTAQRDVGACGAQVRRAEAGRLQLTPTALCQLVGRGGRVHLPSERGGVDAGQLLHVMAVLVGERGHHPDAGGDRVARVVRDAERVRDVDGLVLAAVERPSAPLATADGRQRAGEQDQLRCAVRETGLLHGQPPGAVQARQDQAVVRLGAGVGGRDRLRLQALRGAEGADRVQPAGGDDLVDRRRRGSRRRDRRGGRGGRGRCLGRRRRRAVRRDGHLVAAAPHEEGDACTDHKHGEHDEPDQQRLGRTPRLPPPAGTWRLRNRNRRILPSRRLPPTRRTSPRNPPTSRRATLTPASRPTTSSSTRAATRSRPALPTTSPTAGSRTSAGTTGRRTVALGRAGVSGGAAAARAWPAGRSEGPPCPGSLCVGPPWTGPLGAGPPGVGGWE